MRHFAVRGHSALTGCTCSVVVDADDAVEAGQSFYADMSRDAYTIDCIEAITYAWEDAEVECEGEMRGA